MSYQYEKHRPWTLSDEGQRDLLRVLDNARRLIAAAGAATLGKLISPLTGDTWNHIALVDRLVEMGRLKKAADGWTYSQDDVYVPGPNWVA